MKILFTALLLAAGLTVQAQTQFKTDSVYITGNVKNAAKHFKSTEAVSVIIDDIALADQLVYRCKIKPDGNYRITFNKTGPQNIRIVYAEASTSIIVMPGSHTQINFNADNFEQSLTFKGDDAEVNQDVMAYKEVSKQYNEAKFGKGQVNRDKALTDAMENMQTDTYRNFIAEGYRQDSIFVRQYINTYHPTALFTQWVQADLKCTYWQNVLRYAWRHAKRNPYGPRYFKVADSYFNFLKNIDLNDRQLAISTEYSYLMTVYRLQIADNELGDRPAIEREKEFYDSLHAGFAKDVIVCNWLGRKIVDRQEQTFMPYLNWFKQTVQESAYKASLVSAFNKALDKKKNFVLPMDAKQKVKPDADGDKVLARIIDKYNGKVVYIDFWATWCIPCMNEMPRSKILHNQYAGKDIVFLYLASQSPEKDWKATIAQNGIKGEHVLLKNKDFNALSAKFQVAGIPHYVLVDKTGRVADDNARRPGDQNLPSDIDQLLAVQ